MRYSHSEQKMIAANILASERAVDRRTPLLHEENREKCGFQRAVFTICTISGAGTDRVYHSLCLSGTLARSTETVKHANKRLFSKNSKKTSKKYIKVVTNGGLWCILTMGLGKVYPFDPSEFRLIPER
jgi:hypothetical protein